MQIKSTILVRRKIKFFLGVTLIIGLVYILYQLIIYRELSDEPSNKEHVNLVRGTHELQKSYYQQNEKGHFYCINSQDKINFDQVNDDYCDCLDGSDEPGTNACSNGQFFCAFQKPFHHYPKMIPSSRVNDGICDCCDGSDEWKHKLFPHQFSGK